MNSTSLKYEQLLWSQNLPTVVGIDEVGRGCLAGPLVVAGVVFEPECECLPLVRDSKTLSAKQRELLIEPLKNQAKVFSIQVGAVSAIDEYGIMGVWHRLVRDVLQEIGAVNAVLVDGKVTPKLDFQTTVQTIIKGDQLSYSIAAASILAKVYRDQLMKELGAEFPQYAWERNKGYGTLVHRSAIIEHGVTEHHRLSFLRNILGEV